MVHGLVDVVYPGHRVDVAVCRPLIGVDGGSSSDLSPDKWGGGGGLLRTIARHERSGVSRCVVEASRNPMDR